MSLFKPDSLSGQIRGVLKERSKATTIDQLLRKVGHLISNEAALSAGGKYVDDHRSAREREKGGKLLHCKEHSQEELITIGKRRLLSGILSVMCRREHIKRVKPGVYCSGQPTTDSLLLRKTLLKAAKGLESFTVHTIEGKVAHCIPAAYAASRFKGYLEYEQSRGHAGKAESFALEHKIFLGRRLVVKAAIRSLISKGKLITVCRGTGVYALPPSSNPPPSSNGHSNKGVAPPK